MQIETESFNSRLDRCQYVASRFREFIKGKVLDVGCDEAHIRRLIPGIEYTGIDVSGHPDQVIDLETMDCFPFDDNAFDCVICTEVLEHLDNLHVIFGELIRLSDQYVILSLPNCWDTARRKITRGKGRLKHYGLPLEPPADRHKWFFNFSEALAFLHHQRRVHGFRSIRFHGTERSRPPHQLPSKLLRKLIYSPEQYRNKYVRTLWALIEK